MNMLEDKVRAALRETAAEVTPQQLPRLRIRPAARLVRLATGRGTRLSGWLVPLAGAAAAAAVTIGSVVLAGAIHGQPAPGTGAAGGTAALAGVPPYYVALTGGPGIRQHAAVRATATGRVLATLTPPPPFGTFTWVSAAGDRTFVLAAQRWWTIPSGAASGRAEERDSNTPARFFLLRLGSSGRPGRLTLLPAPRVRSGDLAGVALSPDGSKLALLLHVAEIKVITLATGSARAWTWPGSAGSTTEWAGNSKPMGRPLSWTADGRTLAFQWWFKSGGITQVRLLDTTARGGSLRSSKPVVTFAPPRPGGLKDGPKGNTLVTPDGSKIVGVTWPTPGSAHSRSQVTEFSAHTGKAVRTLDPWSFNGPPGEQDVLWTDATGRTVIVIDPRGPRPGPDRPGGEIGVLSGGRFTPLPRAPQPTVSIAW